MSRRLDLLAPTMFRTTGRAGHQVRRQVALAPPPHPRARGGRGRARAQRAQDHRNLLPAGSVCALVGRREHTVGWSGEHIAFSRQVRWCRSSGLSVLSVLSVSVGRTLSHRLVSSGRENTFTPLCGRVNEHTVSSRLGGRLGERTHRPLVGRENTPFSGRLALSHRRAGSAGGGGAGRCFGECAARVGSARARCVRRAPVVRRAPASTNNSARQRDGGRRRHLSHVPPERPRGAAEGARSRDGAPPDRSRPPLIAAPRAPRLGASSSSCDGAPRVCLSASLRRVTRACRGGVSLRRVMRCDVA